MTLAIPIVVTPPATGAVTLDSLKVFMRLTGDDEDTLLQTLLDAATDQVELYLGRSLITRTLRLTLDRFPIARCELWWDGVREGAIAALTGSSGPIRLPRPPILSITSLTTYTPDDTASVLDPTAYRLDSASGAIVLKDGRSWPTGLREQGGIEIDYQAGYGPNPANVPAAIRTAIMMQAAQSYDSRVCGDLCDGAVKACKSYRIHPMS